MGTTMTGRTARTNRRRELTIDLQGNDVHVSAQNPPGTSGWMVRIPRDLFMTEMQKFLAANQPPAAAGAPPATVTEAGPPTSKQDV